MARLGRSKSVPLVLAALLCFVGLGGTLGTPAHAAQLKQVTISMGYVPNVQFAPFYVAAAKGYYTAAGLNVHFDYAQSVDVITLVGSGKIAFGDAEPDQVIVGAAHGLPIVSVFTQYQRFPVVIFSLASSGIHTFADLKGKTIGIPALYGASYTGLLAALNAAHLAKSDVHISSIGYAQVAAVATHRVDAAVGYAMNEPVQLEQQGIKVSVLPIASQVPLLGPGIVAGKAEIAQDPNTVKSFVQATWRGLRDTNADPAAALALSRSYMPGIPAAQVRTQLAVLKVAVSYWTPARGHLLGCSDAASWKATGQILLQQHQIAKSIDTTPLFTNRFLEHC